MWFHSVLFNAGYCNKEKPKFYKLIGKKSKVFLFIVSKVIAFLTLIDYMLCFIEIMWKLYHII